YGDWKFDIMIGINNADRNTEQILRSVDGVQGTYGAFESWQGVKVSGTNYSIGYLQGVDVKRYKDYAKFRMIGDENSEETFKELDEGRNIIIANMAKNRLDLEVGDDIILEMKSGKKT